MKRHTYLIGAFLLIGLVFGGWQIFLKSDLTSDEPPFDSIVEPLRSVRGSSFMDGGSVWVGVVDQTGASYDFVFPYDHKTQGYPTAFHGAKEPFGPGSIQLADPSRARSIVLDWLKHADRPNEGVEMALDYLSGRNRPVLRRIQQEGFRGILK